MSIRESAPMAPEKARLLNPLQLAYLGDSVWDLLIRSRLLYAGRNVHNMHRAATGSVNAGAQAQALERMAPLLSPEEAEITRRGRNAHAPAPRAPQPESRGLSSRHRPGGAGWAFCMSLGQEERLLELFQRSQEEDTHA